MNIQLKKIIIWPKDKNKDIRVLEFKEGKLNIIHGASQTGKSAIISIIDYCLCASSNKIPIGPIRKKSDWYGVVLSYGEKEILVARSSEKKSEFYYDISPNIQIPTEIFKNTNKPKDSINDLLGITFHKVNEYTSTGNRPSFRDLIAFNFQSQNIVANPNCLLYKTDIAKYRNRLIDIFDYALGIETNKTLTQRKENEYYKKEIEKLENEKELRNQILAEELKKQDLLLMDAVRLGLIKEDEYDIENSRSILSCIKKISGMKFENINISEESQKGFIKRLNELNDELNQLYAKIRVNTSSMRSIEEILNLSKKLNEGKEIERLNISDFIKKFHSSNVKDSTIIDDIDNLCNKMKKYESDYRNGTHPLHSKLEPKLSDIKVEINSNTEKLRETIDKISSMELEKKEREFFDIFIERVGEAKYILSLSDNNHEEIDDKIKEYKSKIFPINKASIAMKIMDKIIGYITDYLPEFAEFKKIKDFDKENLTIKIDDSSEKGAFLSETGSGSNWVAHHIGALLGFHRYFVENEDCKVFNFIIFDQPTQVYYPAAKYDKISKQFTLNQESKDFEDVKKMFLKFNDFINDTNGNSQIFVFDHAGKEVWEELNNVVEIEHWVDGNALIPSDWFN